MLVKLVTSVLLSFAAASSSLALHPPAWFAGAFVNTAVVSTAAPLAPANGKARICVGPARVEVSFVEAPRVVYGGEGCGQNGLAIFAVKLLPSHAGEPSVVVSSLTA